MFPTVEITNLLSFLFEFGKVFNEDKKHSKWHSKKSLTKFERTKNTEEVFDKNHVVFDNRPIPGDEIL